MNSIQCQPPTLRFVVGSTVVPGDRLGTIRQVLPGIGTYVRGGHVYASIVGTLLVSQASEPSRPPSADGATTGEDVTFQATVQGSKDIASSYVLSIGNVVMGRVSRITNQQAFVEILAKNGVGILPVPSEGSVRREDVRPLASEEVTMQENFLPGDMILAKVLSLGDARRYLLTTVAPELGVVHAISSTSGKAMVPASWKEMQCTESGLREARKVAKPREVPGETTKAL